MTASTDCSQFTQEELDTFRESGWWVARRLVPESYLTAMRRVTQRDLLSQEGDVEYEAELQYPGAPESLDSAGGRTIRRLRQAVSRDPVFCQLLKESFLLGRLQQLVGEHVVMPLAHHNCIMTKQPQFSSDTGWHQDTRYWSFSRPDLINLWIALGPETLNNGCLRVIPGSHRRDVTSQRLDDLKFLRSDDSNRDLLDTAVSVELEAGDALFFHARLFHAATRNYSDQPKHSVVFTFRRLDNPPLPDTRSSELPELLLS